MFDDNEVGGDTEETPVEAGDACDHEKVLVETADGAAHRRVCPICDEIQLETLDGADQ